MDADRTGYKSDGSAQDKPAAQYDKDIDADQSRDQYGKIRQCSYETVAIFLDSSRFACPGDIQKNQTGDQCGWQRNHQILPELVFHLASLCLRGCDRRVRYKRQIVTEHGSPCQSAKTERKG